MKIDQKSKVSGPLAERLARMGAALRAHRLTRRLTHDAAAAQCDMSRQTLARIERGDPSVALGQVVRYAEALGVGEQLLGLQAPSASDATRRRVRLTRIERESAAHPA